MQFYSHVTSENRRRAAMAARSYGRRGTPATGRIVKLFVGQGHGFIRLADHREVFFHRADLEDGTSINDLTVGDTVAFEDLDDSVSGPRALRVRRGPVAVAICGGAMNRETQHESDLLGDRDSRGGFDKDQPSEVAGQPIHQGGKRTGDTRSLQEKRSRDRAAIGPESPL
jgi:cold shock CspA family protein